MSFGLATSNSDALLLLLLLLFHMDKLDCFIVESESLQTGSLF